MAFTFGGGFVEKAGAKLLFQGSKKVAALFVKRSVKYLGPIEQVYGNAVLHAERLEEARHALSKVLDTEIGHNHVIMEELQKTHLLLEGKQGTAQAVQVYITPDKKTVVYKSQIDKSSKSYNHIIWTSAVEVKGEGKVLMQGHENYKLINGKPELVKYEEYIPGPNMPLDAVIKKSRNSKKVQAVVQTHYLYGNVHDRVINRFDEFIFKK